MKCMLQKNGYSVSSCTMNRHDMMNDDSSFDFFYCNYLTLKFAVSVCRCLTANLQLYSVKYLFLLSHDIFVNETFPSMMWNRLLYLAILDVLILLMVKSHGCAAPQDEEEKQVIYDKVCGLNRVWWISCWCEQAPQRKAGEEYSNVQRLLKKKSCNLESCIYMWGWVLVF